MLEATITETVLTALSVARAFVIILDRTLSIVSPAYMFGNHREAIIVSMAHGVWRMSHIIDMKRKCNRINAD